MADKCDNIIDQYYSLVDKNLISNLCKNNNLKNLIKLSTISDLYIFNKKNKKWYLKSKDKLLKECDNIKKKELKTSSTLLSNLAKLNTNHNVSEIKDICETLQTKISKLDNIINCINHINTPINIIPKYEHSETLSVSSKKKYNIVSFDEIKESPYIPTIIERPPYQTKIDKLDYLSIINIPKEYSLSDNSDSFIEYYSNC